MRRTPGLFLLLLVLALGVYFAVDPKHTGRPAAEHDRGEEVLVTATMPEAAPADGGGEGPSLDGPTSLASDRSLNFRQRRNGTTSNGSLTDELDAEAQQPTSSSDPAAQPAAPPDLTHYEQYDIKLDSPHKAAKSVALADLQGSRKLLRDFSRFKRTTAEFLTASHRKAFNERLAPANQKRKNKRQVERAKLAAQAQPRGGATDWVTAISEATARPEIKLSGNLTDGASSGAPQRNSSFSEYLRLKNSDPQVVLAISKEYGCKDPDTGKMGTLFGRCPQMAVEEELNAARLKRDEDELVAAPPNGEKASDATTVKIEGSSLVVQRTPVPEEHADGVRKLATNAQPSRPAGRRQERTGRPMSGEEQENAEGSAERTVASESPGESSSGRSGESAGAPLGETIQPEEAAPRQPIAMGRGGSGGGGGGGGGGGAAAAAARGRMVAAAGGGSIITASRTNKTPRSAVKCFDSHKCKDSDCPKAGEEPSCAQQLKGSQKKKGVCDTVLQARTCVYENLYYDSAAEEFLFYAPGDSAEMKLCTVMLRGYYLWEPRVVTALPSAAQLGDHNRTLQVDQIHHPCFAHAFLENTFMLYWSASEYFGRWDYEPSEVTRFIDGHLKSQHKRAQNRFKRSYDQIGRVTDFYGRIQKLVARPETLFAGHQDLKRFPLSRFHTVLVGGSGGRTIWTHNTYSKERPALQVDKEFEDEEKVTAFLNYFDHLARAEGFPSRSVRSADEKPGDGMILLFNREGGSRSISNAGNVLGALKAAFGKRVHPKIVTPAELRFPHIIGFMRKVAIIVTPHGAQIGNAGFMLPGSVLIEVQAKGCFKLAQDRTISNGNCYKHFARYAGLGYANVEGQQGFTCSSQKQYPVSPQAVVGAVRNMLPSVTNFDIRRQLSRTSLRHLAPNDAAPSWSHVRACEKK